MASNAAVVITMQKKKLPSSLSMLLLILVCLTTTTTAESCGCLPYSLKLELDLTPSCTQVTQSWEDGGDIVTESSSCHMLGPPSEVDLEPVKVTSVTVVLVNGKGEELLDTPQETVIASSKKQAVELQLKPTTASLTVNMTAENVEGTTIESTVVLTIANDCSYPVFPEGMLVGWGSVSDYGLPQPDQWDKCPSIPKEQLKPYNKCKRKLRQECGCRTSTDQDLCDNWIGKAKWNCILHDNGILGEEPPVTSDTVCTCNSGFECRKQVLGRRRKGRCSRKLSSRFRSYLQTDLMEQDLNGECLEKKRKRNN